MPYRAIFKNNLNWVAEKLETDPQYFEKLAQGQNPKFLYIGCSDSRVTAEELMGLQPGEIFVHRNVANLVVGADSNLNAVVQYSVERLEVQHIIVCGHYECGGILAAMNPDDMGQLNSWLQSIRDVYRIHRAELDAIADLQSRYDRLVELNVLEQCFNIMKIDHVQRAYQKSGYPKVHAWVFNVRTGILKDLEFKMEEVLKQMEGLYHLKIGS